MLIRHLDRDTLVDTYNLKAWPLYPWSGVAETGFNVGWAIVPPGGESKSHSHHERETFLIVRGAGTMWVGEEATPVEVGSVVLIPPFTGHVLRNGSADDELHFLAIWWEDAAVLSGLVEGQKAARAALIFAHPSASGEQSPEVAAAEIHRRYLHSQGAPARRILLAPETCSNQGVESLHGDLGADSRAVSAALARMRDAGVVVERSVPSPYCPSCRTFVARKDERAAGGRCRSCGFELIERPLPRWCFDVERFRDVVAKRHRSEGLGPALQAKVDQLLAADLSAVPLTEIGRTGFTVSEGAEAPQHLREVVEIAALLAERARSADELWQQWARGEAEAIFFVDLEHAFDYAVLLPTLLAALLGESPPLAYVCGRAAAAARPVFNGDGSREDVLLERAALWVDGGANSGSLCEAFAAWDGWLAEVGAKLARRFGGKVPSTGNWTRAQAELWAGLARRIALVRTAYEQARFSPRQVVEELSHLVADARGFAAREGAWAELANRQETWRSAVALELAAVRALAILAAPLLPAASERLWRDLGHPAPLAPGDGARAHGWIADGADLSALAGPYFAGAAPAAAAELTTLVCASVPNPNGDIHLGHLAGPYLSADICARFRRLLGERAYFLGGSDDYQSWTARQGEKQGWSPFDTATYYSALIEESCRRAGIEIGHFHHPSASKASTEIAQHMVAKLLANGTLIVKERDYPYCEECRLHLFDVYAAGTCPHCGAGACGSGCEGCGRPLDAPDLIEPRCGRCGAKASFRRLKKHYLPLSKLKGELEAYYERVVVNPYQRGLWRKMLEGGLPDVAVSHLSDWGVPLGLPGWEGYCVGAYLQMAADHLASTRTLAEKLGLAGGWQGFWVNDRVRAVQFCGPDNGWVFGIFYPAVFLAYEEGFHPTAAVLPVQWYHLEDRCFSTSRRHAVWVRDLVAASSVDLTRFYCAHTSPEVEITTFRMQEFLDTVDRELLGGWQGWLADLDARMRDRFGGVVPAAELWTLECRRFAGEIERLLAASRAAYEPDGFSPSRATRAACELVRVARRFGRSHDHLRHASSARAERETAMALELAAARGLVAMIAPVMPGFALQLWQGLGFTGDLSALRWSDALELLPAGHRIGRLGAAYFPTLDAAALMALSPGAAAAAPAPPAAASAPERSLAAV